MSDPVTNAEIEDVLSSIRRLVSEEPLRARKKRAPENENLGKFVLTPAFRISERETADHAASDQGSVPDRPDDRSAQADATAQDPDGWTAEDDRNEVSEPADDSVTDQSETSAMDSDEVSVSDGDHPAPEPQEGHTPDDQGQWTEESSGDPQATSSDPMPEPQESAVAPKAEHAAALSVAMAERQTLEQRIAELEAAIGQSLDDWEPDGSEDGSSDRTRPLSFDAADAAPVEDTSDDAEQPDSADADGAEDPWQGAETGPASETGDMPVEARHEDQADNSGGAEPDAADAADDDDSALVDAVEQLFGDRGVNRPMPEGDLSGTHDRSDEDDDIAVVTQPQIDEPEDGLQERWDEGGGNLDRSFVEGSALDVSDDYAEADGDTRQEADLFSDDATLDEEALRELVADIVREELQGVLGERITRNVRRLVRREIQRALAVRDFE